MWFLEIRIHRGRANEPANPHSTSHVPHRGTVRIFTFEQFQVHRPEFIGVTRLQQSSGVRSSCPAETLSCDEHLLNLSSSIPVKDHAGLCFRDLALWIPNIKLPSIKRRTRVSHTLTIWTAVVGVGFAQGIPGLEVWWYGRWWNHSEVRPGGRSLGLWKRENAGLLGWESTDP